MIQIAPSPLSNMQLSLLKLYQNNVSENDLLAINDLIVKYFAQKAQDCADSVWNEKDYNNELMDEWLKTDLRK